MSSIVVKSPALWSRSVGTVTQHRPHGFVMLIVQYKYRVLLLKETHNSFCCKGKANCSFKIMAPHSNPLSTFDHLRFSDRDKMKLRKPIVEKMRRDRINSCIDQLKSLLEKEFHSRDPNTKLEKADILEMTVNFLKQQLPGELAQRDYNEGFSNCWRASIHFLNLHSTGAGCGQELQYLRNVQQAGSAMSSAPPAPSSKLSTANLQKPDARIPVWRPW